MKPNTSHDFKSKIRRYCRNAILLGCCAVGLVLVPKPSAAQQQAISVATQRLIATSNAAADTFFGNVRASEISSLSFGARGCIVEISEGAKRKRVVAAGRILLRLDDPRSRLALRTAEARLSELAAAIEERHLALDAARADDRRREQELDLVSKSLIAAAPCRAAA